MIRVLSDGGAPRAARRDAGEALRHHIAFDATVTDDAAVATWWTAHRGTLAWQPMHHRFAL